MFERARILGFAVAIALVAACDGPPGAEASNGESHERQDWQTLSLNRAAAGEERLAVELEYGAGKLKIAAGSGEQLYQARMRYDASAFQPVTNYRDGRLQIGVEDGQLRGRHMEAGSLDIEVSPDVALDLDLAFGAAEADIDLGGLQLQQLEISTGASRTQLAFSQPNPIAAESIVFEIGAAQFTAKGLGNANTSRLSVEGGVGDIDLDFSGALASDMNVTVEMGLGRLTLRLPRGVGVRIEKDGVLAKITGEGLLQQDNVYYNANYESAERHLQFDVDAAFNTIDIVWIDNDQANAR